MPFWWRRRKRYWWPRTRYQRRRRRPYRRRRKRLYRRRRAAKPYRRRRRRHRYKVRRKRKKIPIYQWQPDSIRNCKIKGVDVLVLGAHGKQFVCYTDVKQRAPPPRAPGGGGFGCEQWSLGLLYEQYKFRRNIWTASNITKDLCRYLGGKIVFYRHAHIDFIINYDLQPPFILDELTYLTCHPQNLLLGRHKKLILSLQTKPTGKLTKKIKFKPPKQMLNKWFFQEQFSAAGLIQLKAAACSLQYSHIGSSARNQTVTFFAINPGFYQQGNWAYDGGEKKPYMPYLAMKSNLYYWDTTDWPPNPDAAWLNKHSTTVDHTTYTKSVSYDKGFFQSKVLSAKLVTTDKSKESAIANLPLNICRYNPNIDTGKGNTIWLHSNLTTSYSKPSTDKTIILQGYPIWLMLYGWLSYVQHVKGVPDFYLSYTLLIESPAIEVASKSVTPTPIIPIDNSFVNGNAPYEQILSKQDLTHWYPDIYNQTEIINSIVTSGPYVPKLDNIKNSTWELHYFYQFFFKWGGPEETEQPVADPTKKPTYNAFDTVTPTVQIRNPAKQKYESLLHPWDARRGIIKKSALKRMRENLSTDTDFQESGISPKKTKITGPCLTALQEINQEERACLQTLCEENIFQEIQEGQDLQQLIQQQQHQQQELKYNILKLISFMKEQQNMLKLHTGMLN
nr:MAG: ORF1 [Torque teno midi virus]